MVRNVLINAFVINFKLNLFNLLPKIITGITKIRIYINHLNLRGYRGNIMKGLNIFYMFIIPVLIVHCADNTIQKADEAFNNGKYLQAINFYKTALQKNPQDEKLKEKMALSYMYNGELGYSKTGNVNAFAGNLEKARTFFPSVPSDAFNKIHSQILVELSKAYINAKPDNDIEKEEFFFESISTLEQSLELDSTNVEADSLLAEMKIKHFEKLLNTANSYYTRGAKERNVDYYFAAKKNLNMAKKFNSTHPDVINLEVKLRRKLGGILDYHEGLSFAILRSLKEKEYFVAYLAIKNYLTDSVNINLNNFSVVDMKGNTYNVSEKEMDVRRVYEPEYLVNTTLTPQKSYVEGILVFSAPDSAEVQYISYKKDDTTSIRKYFR